MEDREASEFLRELIKNHEIEAAMDFLSSEEGARCINYADTDVRFGSCALAI